MKEKSFFVKLIRGVLYFLNFNMDINDALFGTQHDKVVRASASSYNPEQLRGLGLQITLNLSNQKVRFLGEATNPVYPDVVIWRPDFPGSNTGQAVIVELIENDNFTHGGLSTWIRLANTIGVRFNLIVPIARLENARTIINSNRIPNVRLQTWKYDTNLGRYIFNTKT